MKRFLAPAALILVLMLPAFAQVSGFSYTVYPQYPSEAVRVCNQNPYNYQTYDFTTITSFRQHWSFQATLAPGTCRSISVPDSPASGDSIVEVDLDRWW